MLEENKNDGRLLKSRRSTLLEIYKCVRANGSGKGSVGCNF